MPKFVREKMLGGYTEVAGGHSDPECTHVILKAAEYDKVLDEKDLQKGKLLLPGQMVNGRFKR